MTSVNAGEFQHSGPDGGHPSNSVLGAYRGPEWHVTEQLKRQGPCPTELTATAQVAKGPDRRPWGRVNLEKEGMAESAKRCSGGFGWVGMERGHRGWGGADEDAESQ